MAGEMETRGTSLHSGALTALVGWLIIGGGFPLTLAAQEPVKIKRLCRVKGQETSVVRGIGLVVGLNGTGDPDLLTTSLSLAQAINASGLRMPQDQNGRQLIQDFDGTQSAALVFIAAEVPAAGVRQGSRVNASVSALGGATSIVGGTLIEAVLTGGPFQGETDELPNLAMAFGTVERVDPTMSTRGTIYRGCQFNVDLEHRFYYYDEPVRLNVQNMATDPLNGPRVPAVKERSDAKQMYFDLVVRDEHASFGTAAEIAETLRAYRLFQASELVPLAKDQVTIQVPIPDQYTEDPVSFVAQIENLEVLDKPKSTTVFINQAAGIVIIGDEVRFDPAAISSADFAVETGPIRSLDLDSNLPVAPGPGVELKKLQQALSQLQATPDTLIEIIKGLNEAGFLYGDLMLAAPTSR